MVMGNMREQDGQERRGMEGENNEREVLIERITVRLGRNLMLEKFPRVHKDDPSSDS